MNIEFISEKRPGKDIKVGDYVLAYNEREQKKEFCKINIVHRPIVPKKEQVQIITETGSDIITSTKHPTLIQKKNGTLGYVLPGAINSEEDKLVTQDKDGNTFFDRIRSITFGLNEDENFVDFEVDKNNNYFASRKDTPMSVVHNSRAGAISVTLDVFHRDIYDFLDLQTETGDIRSKSFDVFPAVSFPDLFMERMEKNEEWTLFDPKEILDVTGKSLENHFGDEFRKFYEQCEKDDRLKLKKKTSAKELFKTYLKSVVETGMPYAFFRDTVNAVNPNKHVGNVYSTQLCVTGDTELNIRVNGEEKTIQIKDLDSYKITSNIEVLTKNLETDIDEYRYIMNFAETNSEAEIIEITDSETGKTLRCTPEHKIYTRTRGYVQAKDLKETDILEYNKI